MKLARATLVVAAALAMAVAMSNAMAQPQPRAPRTTKPPAGAVQSVDADSVFAAVVKVTAHAVPGARSSATLGSDREGTGIVIGDNGLILTIGYLIVEADDVERRRQQRPHARRARRWLRPRHRVRARAHDRAARREARSPGRIGQGNAAAIR